MIDAVSDFTSRLSAAIVAAERKIEAVKRDLAAAEGALRGLIEAREQFDLTKEVLDAIKRREREDMDRLMFYEHETNSASCP